MNFTISISDFNDAVILEEWAFVNANIEFARKIVAAKGKVVFEQRFTNAPTIVLLTIYTLDELAQWETRLKEVISKLKNLNNKGKNE